MTNELYKVHLVCAHWDDGVSYIGILNHECAIQAFSRSRVAMPEDATARVMLLLIDRVEDDIFKVRLSCPSKAIVEEDCVLASLICGVNLVERDIFIGIECGYYTPSSFLKC